MGANAKKLVAWAVVMMSITGVAAAEDVPIKQLMGENFNHVALILNQLIAARYDALPQEADTIRKHAVQLIEKPPASLTTKDQGKFLTFATFLMNSASSLQEVTTQLAKRDKERAKPGELSVDYLRVAAAEHFGNVITACVLCHNQFRRRTL